MIFVHLYSLETGEAYKKYFRGMPEWHEGITNTFVVAFSFVLETGCSSFHAIKVEIEASIKQQSIL